MRRAVTVLKFGSSVLRSEADLPLAVHEIYRWVGNGQRVIAVVSAIGNATDALLARARSYGATASERGIAALLATGETTSAALLSLALDRAGIPAVVLDEVQAGLATTGPILDAELCGLNVEQLLRRFESAAVLVIPGFVGRQTDGSISLLGRGGTDLTAVFVAERVAADRCRLIKDVDGIFDRDPAIAPQRARRYRTLFWGDARKIDGGVVQGKAIEFAERNGFPFEVAAADSDTPTTIGPAPTAFYSESGPSTARERSAGLQPSQCDSAEYAVRRFA